MKTLLAIALTIVCWGIYGPVIHQGQHAMDGARLRPFICVGLAYFLIAVLVPLGLLRLKGEKGAWTFSGTIWSLVAGAAGAIGALGVIMAFNFHGRPVFVMPLVFGGAPVINSFLTIFMARLAKKVGPVFIAGLILVVAGAVTVMLFKPGEGAAGIDKLSVKDLSFVVASIAVVILSWGVYGPVLHKGQMKMAGSRLRPLVCVGLAYFAIAVLVPAILLPTMEPNASFNVMGTLWSLAGGAAGAFGALGIIMAFATGGKPIYVMPLVFGGAPVINTFVTLWKTGESATPSPFFYAGLIVVAIGAVIVLVFAPKSPPPPVQTPAETVDLTTMTVVHPKL